MRIANRNAQEQVKSLTPFEGSNLNATLTSRFYVVYSYGYYPIYIYDLENKVWFECIDKYSPTTAKHITQSRPTEDTIKFNQFQMKAIL